VGVGVRVGVTVGDAVPVPDGVCVCVAERDGVCDGVGVRVGVCELVGVLVGVRVGVCVGVGVCDGVGVGVTASSSSQITQRDSVGSYVNHVPEYVPIAIAVSPKLNDAPPFQFV
jgi:hypothetical protein